MNKELNWIELYEPFFEIRALEKLRTARNTVEYKKNEEKNIGKMRNLVGK